MASLEVVTPTNLLIEVGKLGSWIQALGLVVVLWIVFEVVALIVNRKKRKALYRIKEDLARIESKLDRALKQQSRKKS